MATETSARHTPDVLCAAIGPTASGKSDLALELACVLPDALDTSGVGEIAFVDALQLYRGMDVGTAKTSVEERRGIAHHQTDVLEVRDETSVAVHQKRARADVTGTHEREGVTVVVGGSGLYQRALLDAIEFLDTGPAIRARFEEEAEGPMGSRGLHDHLIQLDPVSTEHIDPYNACRIIHTLEIIELAGRSYSASMPHHEFMVPSLTVALRCPMEELDGCIAVRTRAIMDDGLAGEVRALIDVSLRKAEIASRATGYAQMLAAINGRMDEDEAMESIALATHQLVRRQVK